MRPEDLITYIHAPIPPTNLENQQQCWFSCSGTFHFSFTLAAPVDLESEETNEVHSDGNTLQITGLAGFLRTHLGDSNRVVVVHAFDPRAQEADAGRSL